MGITGFAWVLPFLTAAAPVSVGERAAAKAIEPEALRAHTRFLASDLLEGRGPGTQGDRLAQEYIAAQLEALGLKPGSAEGSYFQPFELVGLSGHPEKLSFASGVKKLELAYHEEMMAVAGAQKPEAKLEGAELVFAGYGIVAPEFGWNDYQGLDLKDKVVVLLNNDPEDDPSLFAGKTRLWYGRWDYKYETAARLGASGALIIHTTPSAGYPWQVVQTSWSGEQFELPRAGEPALEVKGWLTESATRRLMAFSGKNLEALRAAAQVRGFKPVPLGVTVSTGFKNLVQRKRTANVLGLLPGSDRELARELVVYTAHHDHLGKQETAKAGEDAIYNGAVDNASGVAAMLAVARAMKALPKPPRRSVLFAAVAAEEQGLLGSQYLVEHSPVPVGAMAAEINIDGVNIWGRTRDVTLIGLGKSNLDGWVKAAAAVQGRVTKPDQLPDRGFFYRSDQLNFARAGVPAAYFGSGLDFVGRPEGWGKRQREIWEETHYHQPSDELSDEWDLSGAVEDAQLYFYLGVLVANAPRMPEWNKGDEFEAARKRALETLAKERSSSAPAVRR